MLVWVRDEWCLDAEVGSDVRTGRRSGRARPQHIVVTSGDSKWSEVENSFGPRLFAAGEEWVADAGVIVAKGGCSETIVVRRSGPDVDAPAWTGVVKTEERDVPYLEGWRPHRFVNRSFGISEAAFLQVTTARGTAVFPGNLLMQVIPSDELAAPVRVTAFDLAGNSSPTLLFDGPESLGVLSAPEPLLPALAALLAASPDNGRSR